MVPRLCRTCFLKALKQMAKIFKVLLTSDFFIFIIFVHAFQKRVNDRTFSLKKAREKKTWLMKYSQRSGKTTLNIFAYDLKLIAEQVREFFSSHGFCVAIFFSIPLKACLYNFLGFRDRQLFFARLLICHGAWNKNIQVKQTTKKESAYKGAAKGKPSFTYPSWVKTWEGLEKSKQEISQRSSVQFL